MLTITNILARNIVEHARIARPSEACGLVIGSHGWPLGTLRVSNVSTNPIHEFRMDDDELLEAYAAIDANGDELIGVYHSHPTTDAWPSEMDHAMLSVIEDVHCIIVGHQYDFKSFHVLNGQLIEEEVRLVNAYPTPA